MSATKNRGVSGLSELEILVALKASQAATLILAGNRGDDQPGLKTLNDSLQWFLDRQPVTVEGEVLKPKTFQEFLVLPKPTQGQFNQLESETAWWTLLDQIEESCFLQPDKLAIARSFLLKLWQGEIAKNPFQQKGWGYLLVPEAVERLRNIFGSSLKADQVLKLAKNAKPRKESEGVPTWIKLTTLAGLFEISGNPLEDSDEGREAYAAVVKKFIPQVGGAYVQAHGKEFTFTNWREGALTGKHIILTPAGRATWQWLESQSDDDFVIAPAGAINGNSYAGYSQRLARLRIGLSGNQMPQDCIMTGDTLMIQPDRLCKREHLRIDNPGNAYSSVGDGGFWGCVGWQFDAGARQLGFGSGDAGNAYQVFGSAVVLRP